MSLVRKFLKIFNGLKGYWNVDLIYDKCKDKFYIIEVNLRTSTSYLGLSRLFSRKYVGNCLVNLSSEFKLDINEVETRFIYYIHGKAYDRRSYEELTSLPDLGNGIIIGQVFNMSCEIVKSLLNRLNIARPTYFNALDILSNHCM